MGDGAKQAVAVSRVFTQQPDRVAAAWRRVRFAQQKKGATLHNLLDDVIEPFIRAIGGSLAGEATSAWTRTQGVLRLAPGSGAKPLYDEFISLRRCLVDALEVLGGGEAERTIVERAVDEAVDSAVAVLQRMTNPAAAGPRVPFGGLIVEFFDRVPGPVLVAAPRSRPIVAMH